MITILAAVVWCLIYLGIEAVDGKRVWGYFLIVALAFLCVFLAGSDLMLTDLKLHYPDLQFVLTGGFIGGIVFLLYKVVRK